MSITTHDKQRFRETFLLVDRDGDSVVSFEEFKTFMASLGRISNDDTLKGMLSSVSDTNSLNEDQFITLCSKWKKNSCSQQEINDALSVFDKSDQSDDSMGYISAKELNNALCNMGHDPLSHQEAAYLLQRAYKNEDGLIHYKNWVEFLLKSK